MEEKQRLYTIVAVAAVAAIVLSCVAGALAGALTGLIVGQEQGQAAAERAIARERAFREQEEAVPVPLPEVPELVPRSDVQGAVVVEVIAGTPAEEAGLRLGDVIVAVDRVPIDSSHDLGDVLAQYEPGDRVTLGVWRSGQRIRVPVVLGKHATRSGQPYLGIRYQMNTGLERPNE